VIPTKRDWLRLLCQCTAETARRIGGAARAAHRGAEPAFPRRERRGLQRFGNDELRGSFTFLGPSKLFSRLHPLPPTVTPRDLTDWACELVNQSVGRFRNRLLAYGVKLALSVPQSALARVCVWPPVCSPLAVRHCLAIDGMVLEGWLVT